ncbi:MAG: SIR2 family protein [Flavobacteriales bacterium]|jgi:hypothetical protein|nr:SIR2 family protein [Flavobacteriales bacterium]
MEEEDLDDLHDSIAGNIKDTVLILGPELAVAPDGKDYKTYFKELAQNESDTVSKYFDVENLFALRDGVHSRGLRKKVKKFYSEVGDAALLNSIARIKFPLIVNVSPDLALVKTYEQMGMKQGEDFEYRCFRGEPNQDELDDPSCEKPIIYNICGSVDENYSLILTHGKLFETMEHLLQENSLPDTINNFINGNRNFIFLGFNFESWHYQLICHKFKIGKSNQEDTTVISTPDYGDNELVGLVMGNHFSMDFTGENPAQCIERIVDFCEDEYPGSLRETGSTNQQIKSVYVSYKWKDEGDTSAITKESIVDWLEDELPKKSDHVKLIRDATTMSYGDSVDSFMTRIGKGKAVVRVLSDGYLRSKYCMDEAMRVDKYKDKDKRIFTVVLDDLILDDDCLERYRKYWRDESQAIYDRIDEHHTDIVSKNKERNKRDNQIAFEIYEFLDYFLTQVKQELYLPVKKTDLNKTDTVLLASADSNDKLNKFVDDLLEKLNE